MTAETPNVIGLDVYQNADFAFSWQYTDANGDAIDLSGYSALMEVRPGPGEDPVLSLSTTAGTIALDSSGNINGGVAAATTKAIDFGAYRYDLHLIAPGGARVMFARGWLRVWPGITEA